MGDDWAIRQSTAQNLEGVVACIESAYAPLRARSIDLPAVSEGISDDIAEQNVWMVERNKCILAVLVTALTKEQYHIANIAVAPKAQGMGIGRALMEHAERQAQRLSYTEMRLVTHVDMIDTQALYEHLGWHEVGRSGNKVMFSKAVLQQFPADD